MLSSSSNEKHLTVSKQNVKTVKYFELIIFSLDILILETVAWPVLEQTHNTCK